MSMFPECAISACVEAMDAQLEEVSSWIHEQYKNTSKRIDFKCFRMQKWRVKFCAVQEELNHISCRYRDNAHWLPAQGASTLNDLCHQLSGLNINSESTSMHHERSHSVNPSWHSAIQEVIAWLSEIEASVAALQLKVALTSETGNMYSANSMGFVLNPFYMTAIASKLTLPRSP